jgi:hypothetical protein
MCSPLLFVVNLNLSMLVYAGFPLSRDRGSALATRCSLFATRCSLFATRCSLLAARYSLLFFTTQAKYLLSGLITRRDTVPFT